MNCSVAVALVGAFEGMQRSGAAVVSGRWRRRDAKARNMTSPRHNRQGVPPGGGEQFVAASAFALASAMNRSVTAWPCIDEAGRCAALML